MSNPFVVAIGRLTRLAARLRGGGSALPGLVVERLSPRFMADTLAQLPQGVLLVSGTNGKTTTTRIITQVLEAQGLKVFTNPTGSNFTRGVVAALLGEVDWRGELHADIAVLELDEAHAVHFVEQVRPRVSVLLNVLRDQLDRFGEIDTTAELLGTVARATTETVVLNREDPRVRAIAETLPESTNVRYFGFAEGLSQLFPDDESLHDGHESRDAHVSSELARHTPHADVRLDVVDGQQVAYEIDDTSYPVTLQLSGAHNALNAAAALAGVRALASAEHPIDTGELIDALGTVTAAFGRGEVLKVWGRPVRITLVKNPSGFRSSLRSAEPRECVLIAINDAYADGRDLSWLWDVDFSALRKRGVSVVSGVRAAEMALRLRYDLVDVDTVEPDFAKALAHVLNDNPGLPVRIFATYTAMLRLRRELRQYTTVSRMGE